jgi:hypothetical protein
MPSSKVKMPYRDILLISVLIAGVCFLTLTPAMYLVFHALQWKRALRIVEAAFLPALLLAIAAGLLAYQRARLRQGLRNGEDAHEESS